MGGLGFVSIWREIKLMPSKEILGQGTPLAGDSLADFDASSGVHRRLYQEVRRDDPRVDRAAGRSPGSTHSLWDFLVGPAGEAISLLFRRGGRHALSESLRSMA